MDTSEAIFKRRTIRKFKKTSISTEIIEKIIAFGHHAPSHCDAQPWRFIVVDAQEIKRQIVDHGGSKIIDESPAGIVICCAHDSVNQEYQDWLQSAAAAAQNMHLGAYALGLSSCWICHLPSKKALRRILGIPSDFSPVAYLAMGYAQRHPEDVPRRRPLKDIYAFNHFPHSAEEGQKSLGLPLKRLARKFYYFLPKAIKKKINPWVDRHFVKKFTN